MKKNDGVERTMDVTDKSQVIESLEQNEVVFALVSVLPKKLKVDKVALMENKLFFVASSDLKLPKNFTKKNLFEKLLLIY
jgi:hypothetical protein